MPSMLPVPSMADTCRFLSDPKLDGRHPGGDGHEIAKQYLVSFRQACVIVGGAVK